MLGFICHRKYLAARLGIDIGGISFEDLKGMAARKQAETAVCNRHRWEPRKGYLWAARQLGQDAVVFLPKGSAEARVRNIEREGARAMS